ncbi:MAG: pantoate--beta-alanine ligase [Acidimicrobiales bacterium]|jgi:pantoate--beta-alanine ligase
MEFVTTREGLRKATSAAHDAGARLGLVPTMGSLHEGHMSLLQAASADCEVVALSVFVNPIQFSSAEDLARYPSDLERDLELARTSGAGIVFAPSVAEMYPDGEPETRVEPGRLAERLEGAARPGHFAGVATVVTKLLSLCGHCRAYFGEKDFQQLVVVRQLVGDLDLDAEIVGCATVREADGLACSSRNRRLESADREAAGVLFKALMAGRVCVTGGEQDAARVEETMAAVVGAEPRANLDYAKVVDPITLDSPGVLAGELRLLISATLGPVRLIDNMAVRA